MLDPAFQCTRQKGLYKEAFKHIYCVVVFDNNFFDILYDVSSLAPVILGLQRCTINSCFEKKVYDAVYSMINEYKFDWYQDLVPQQRQHSLILTSIDGITFKSVVSPRFVGWVDYG